MNLNSLPKTPGVYLLKRGTKVLYVGKTLNLRDRVKTHLTAKQVISPRQKQMRQEVDKVDYIGVRSDFEALLLEINLIKKYLPEFNIKLKDDKDYLYIKITEEDFPRVLAVRKRDLGGSLFYLGPFPNANIVRRTLKSIRRVFPYCTETKKTGKPCFYTHLGLCLGPCAHQISAKDYKKMIRQLIAFLAGKTEKVTKDLEKQMLQASTRENFEEAARLRDKIQGISYLVQQNRISDYLQKPDILEDLLQEEEDHLAEVLKLEGPIQRIECYDISNTSGTYSVGSMVVFADGQPDKGEYRRFRIKKVRGIDDFASLQEVLRRRFHNDWTLPDLVVIDGGKGQLSAVKEVFEELNIKIPLISLAKREEEIFTASGDRIVLERTNPALQLIQRLRDEAHRFAITYHRKLRSDALVKILPK